jgi:hypothetical protein
MAVESPVFDPGVFLYRARKVTPAFNKKLGIKYDDIIQPPKQIARLGRINRDNEPVFYCSMNKEAVFFELEGVSTNDEVILTFWVTTDKMFVNNIGYTEHVFERLGAKRPCPLWIPAERQPENKRQPQSNQATVSLPILPERDLEAVLARDDNGELRKAFSQYFMAEVEPTQRYEYKLTTAIGELHLGTITNLGRQFAGILYPSVSMWANGDNLALLPSFVGEHLEFRKAVHFRIDRRDRTTFSVTRLDFAKNFGADGNLNWFGRLPRWTVQPGQAAKFTVAPGFDDDGDYETDANGVACHWTAADAANGVRIDVN